MNEHSPSAGPSGTSPTDQLPGDVVDLACARLLAVDAEEEAAVLAELCRLHPEHATGLQHLRAELRGTERLLQGSMAATVEGDPTAIGPLNVVRRLGEGAFGVVYLCTQKAPIERQVAVKVLRPGAGNRHTLARFDVERQVLAAMNHPAIANVFDAGALPDGRPYFVMEYVEGEPITAFCDRHRLSVTDRLTLFLALCDGVQHAHQKGVIHRDIKPSNVLVQAASSQETATPVPGQLQGEARPKIIDFGLAKVIHQAPPQGTQLTEAGGVLGTPGFMSPEQLDGRQDDVDTRADVFSLGVILYGLLTGAMPWSDEESSADSAPPRPSSRLASTNKRASDAAKRRSGEPRRLQSQLRGDLDWITLRALERERERRYQSVQELAEDIRRHLRVEPVLAGPPSRVYRLRKLARRYRVQAIAVLAVLLSLLVGMVGMARYASQAHDSLQRYETLAIGSRLALARSLAGQLYPPWPHRLPDFERWLREHGESLRAELPRLQQALTELRAQAISTDAADLDGPDARPVNADIAKRRATVAYIDALLAHPAVQTTERAQLRTTLEDQRQKVGAEIPGLERMQEERQSWRFANAGQQFLHDTLVRFEDDLRRFCEDPSFGVQAAVGHRQYILDELAAQEWRGELWRRTRAEIAADTRYGGLQLAPQFGLVPLGPDPHTKLHEFYHPRSGPKNGAIPTRDADGRLDLDVTSGIVFVLLPGGRALLGAQSSAPDAPYYDPEAKTAESPVHEVTLAPFFLGKHEVTQSQWWSLTDALPSHFHAKTVAPPGREITRRHPLENVTWTEGQVGLGKHGLDLPTEAQWEYACRAGTSTVWSTGQAEATLVGVADMPGVGERVGETDASGVWHAAVGSLSPNAFGLHDMIGNVAEWCRDSFSSLAYLLPPRAGDGLRPVPEMQARAVRGGAFDSLPRAGSSAVRHPVTYNTRAPNVGVRAARRVQVQGEAQVPAVGR